jgi:hypothetical protein
MIQSAMLPLLTELDTVVGCAENEQIVITPINQVRKAIDMNWFVMICQIIYTSWFQLTWKKRFFKNVDDIIQSDIEEEAETRDDGTKQFVLTVPEASP